MWEIVFSEVDSDRELGRVRFDGKEITSDPGIRSMVDGYSPEDVHARFAYWSNGYVKSRLA